MIAGGSTNSQALRERGPDVALTAVDRALLQRCLNHQPGAWNDFVDRFLGVIYHVISHSAHLRSAPLHAEDTEDLAAEILLQIVANDYAVLRQFHGNSSLATYLTVIARRICVHELARRALPPRSCNAATARRLNPRRGPKVRAASRTWKRSKSSLANCPAANGKWFACTTWRAAVTRRLVSS